jgi:hypothetical protein
MAGVFEMLGNSIEEWRSIAEALAYNAGVLTEHRAKHEKERNQHEEAQHIGSVDMVFASLILWGYALEGFLKCIYLKNGGLLVQSGKFSGWGKDHDLVWMADHTQVQLTASQRRILEHLSVIARWSGRYPIATSDKESSLAHYWCEPEDDNALKELVDAFRAKIGAG